ncbi:MAG: hypothetical protein U5R31_15655 [Acidimicrobiia bacterium]|nr:hypothetical protein [Acidimicrobiia bacterium]
MTCVDPAAASAAPPTYACSSTWARRRWPNALLGPEDLESGTEEFFPLEVAFCPDSGLVQLLEDVAASKLFVDNYLYFSSFSDQLLRHSRDARRCP